MIKKFTCTLLFCLFGLLNCSLAQPLAIEAWVKRIPLVADSTEFQTTECIYQGVNVIFEPKKFGFVSYTDTLALDLLYTAEFTSVWKDSITSDNYSIFMMEAKDGNIIFFITPLTRRRAKFALVMSSSNLCSK